MPGFFPDTKGNNLIKFQNIIYLFSKGKLGVFTLSGECL